MASIDDSDVPETGAVFTFGRSRFADTLANKFWIRNDKIIHVACGDEHSIVVTERGRLYGFGANDWGQLGLGHTKSVNKPSFIKALKGEKMTTASCGRTHSLVATASGKVFSFGAGGDGQLGHGDTEDYHSPKQIAGLPLEKVKILSCGVYHSAILFESGDLYIWGTSGEGQTGQEEEELLSPTILSVDDKVSWVSCGYYHTALVTEDGKLFTFGEDENGKLGLKEEQLSNTSRPQPVATKDGHFAAVACGSGHTLALTQDGKVFSFGDGSRGQLGQGTRVQELKEPSMIQQLSQMKVKSISCGDCHSAVITESGKLYTFGDGRHGKLGQGEECFSNQFRPVKVARFENFTVESVSCGGCHSLVTAVMKEPGTSDEEDVEDGLLNASMTSSYSHLSIDEANATMKPFGLSNTLPSVSPRDKRRQKESENLANSFSGGIGNSKGGGLPLATLPLDRSRLPQIPKLSVKKEEKEQKIEKKEIQSQKSAMPAVKGESAKASKIVEKENKKNKDVDFLRRKIEDELDEEAENSKERNKKAVEVKKSDKKLEESEEEESDEEYETDEEEDDEEEEDTSKKVGNKAVVKKEADVKVKKSTKKVEEEEEDDDDEKEEDGESEYETDEEEDDEEEEAQKKNGKGAEDKKNVKTVPAEKDAKKTVKSEGKKKVKVEEEDDDDDDEDDDDEDDEDDEEEEDDDEDEDEEDEDEEDDEDEEEDTETERKVEKSKKGVEKEKKTGKKEETEKEKEKVKNKKDKKKEKDEESNENEDEKVEGSEDKEKEVNNNKTENENETKKEEQQPPKKSKFANLFGRKKQQQPTKNAEQKTEEKSEENADQKTEENTDQKVEQDQVDGPKQVNATKKSGKSGVCTIL